MNIKHLLLYALLSGVATTRCNDNEIEQERISAAIEKTIAKIKELGDEISKQEEKISVLGKKGADLCEAYIKRKREEFKKKGLSNKAIDQEIADMQVAMEKDIRDCCESTFKPDDSIYCLFGDVLTDDIANYALLKFNLMRYDYERLMLVRLIAEWQTRVKGLMQLFQLNDSVQNNNK